MSICSQLPLAANYQFKMLNRSKLSVWCVGALRDKLHSYLSLYLFLSLCFQDMDASLLSGRMKGGGGVGGGHGNGVPAAARVPYSAALQPGGKSHTDTLSELKSVRSPYLTNVYVCVLQRSECCPPFQQYRSSPVFPQCRLLQVCETAVEFSQEKAAGTEQSARCF